MKNQILTVLILLSALFASGCQTVSNYTTKDVASENKQAAKKLGQALKSQNVNSLAVTTLVNVKTVSYTEPLGQISSEMLMAQLVEQGINITEIKLGGSIRIQEDGEFILSRDTNHLREAPELEHVLVGTFMRVPDGIWVTARIVHFQSRKVITAVNYFVPQTKQNLF